MLEEAWEELESMEPDLRANPAMLALRVRICLAKSKPAEAARVAVGWVRVEPWSMFARELAAKALEEQGRLSDAVSYFRHGRLLVRMGRTKEGCAKLTRAVELDQAIWQRILDDETREDIWWLTPREE